MENTMKTAELTGLQLAWAVAMCQGYTQIRRNPHRFDDSWIIRPEGENQGWLFLEDYLRALNSGRAMDIFESLPKLQFWYWGGSEREEMQCACLPVKEDGGTRLTTYFGKNKKTAGLRAYVASKLGENVDMPEGLV